MYLEVRSRPFDGFEAQREMRADGSLDGWHSHGRGLHIHRHAWQSLVETVAVVASLQ